MYAGGLLKHFNNAVKVADIFGKGPFSWGKATGEYMVRQHEANVKQEKIAIRDYKREWAKLQRQVTKELVDLLKKNKLDKQAQKEILKELEDKYLDDKDKFDGTKKDTNGLVTRIQDGLITPTNLGKIRDKIKSYNKEEDNVQKAIQQATNVILMGSAACAVRVILHSNTR